MLKRFVTITALAVLPLVAGCDSRAKAPEPGTGPDQSGRPVATDDRAAPNGERGAAPAEGTKSTTPSAAETRKADETRNPVAKMLSREPDFREVTVPAGTVVPVELETTVSSATSNVEDPVRATVRTPVTIDGYAAIPAGSTMTGVVTDATRSARVKGRAHVAFRFNELRAHDATFDVRSSAIGRTAPGTKKKDATKIGIGAGAGAVIGGIVGGGSGAAKGAAIGGAGGTGYVLATRGKEVSLPAGTNLAVKLLEPITVRVPVKR